MPLFHLEDWLRRGAGEGRYEEKGDVQIRLVVFSSMADIHSVIKVQQLESVRRVGPFCRRNSLLVGRIVHFAGMRESIRIAHCAGGRCEWVNQAKLLCQEVKNGRVARAKHYHNREDAAGYIHRPRKGLSKDSMLVNHIKPEVRLRKPGWMKCPWSHHLSATDYTLSLWLNKKNGIHRPSGANGASGKVNRREY